jgi:hypothetical protein
MRKYLFSLFFILFSSVSLAVHANAHVVLKELSKTESLKPLIEWINEHKAKIPESEMALAFDFDGTITDLDSTKKGPKKGDAALRGGADSRAMFHFLDAQKMKWFILSAKASTKLAVESVALKLASVLALDQPEWSKVPPSCTITKDKFGSFNTKAKDEMKGNFHFDGKTYNTLQCNNIITAVEPTEARDQGAFHKDVSLEYALSLYFTEYPKFIIFADDNARNVMTIYNYFKTGKGAGKNVEVIAVLFDPQTEEPGHAEALTEFKAAMHGNK